MFFVDLRTYNYSGLQIVIWRSPGLISPHINPV